MHFTVLVIGQNPENLLAPFQENNMGDVPDEYMELQIEVEKDEAEDYHQEQLKKMSKIDRSKYAGMSIKNFMKEWGYYQDDEGNYGYRCNPNSMWDWHSLGGRWRGYFKLKKGKQGFLGGAGLGGNEPMRKGGIDQALKGNIDFEGMKNEEIEEGTMHWREYTKKKNRYKKLTDSMFGSNFGIETKDTKRRYLKRISAITTNIKEILKDGEWYSDVTEKDFDRLMADVPNDELISLYDCHT